MKKGLVQKYALLGMKVRLNKKKNKSTQAQLSFELNANVSKLTSAHVLLTSLVFNISKYYKNGNFDLMLVLEDHNNRDMSV